MTQPLRFWDMLHMKNNETKEMEMIEIRKEIENLKHEILIMKRNARNHGIIL